MLVGGTADSATFQSLPWPGRGEEGERSRGGAEPVRWKLFLILMVEGAATGKPRGKLELHFPECLLHSLGRASGEICGDAERVRWEWRSSYHSQKSASWLWWECKAEEPACAFRLALLSLQVPLSCRAAALVTNRNPRPFSHPKDVEEQLCRLLLVSAFALPCPTPSAGQACLPCFPCQHPPFGPHSHSGELASKSSFLASRIVCGLTL